MGFYIPSGARQNLLKYKYSSTDHSLISKHILGPYWTWLVELFPLSIAPNLITLLGLFFVLINFATLLSYGPTLHCALNGEGCMPRWIYGTFAIGLFLYQSFDAIDGKQARRTGTSGPLGELFDHCCDALNTTLEVLLSASALNLGLSWWTVTALVATNANFYLTTWEEFHTGNLFLSAFSGPVEGILLIILVFTITSITGPSIWDTGLFEMIGLSKYVGVHDTALNTLFMCGSTVGLFFNIITSTLNVYHSLPVNRTPSSILKPLSRLLPYLVHSATMASWLYFSPSLLSQLVPFSLFWGISFAHHVGLLILSHLTKSPFPSISHHPLLIISLVGLVDSLLGTQSTRQAATIWSLVGVSVVVYGHFVWEVISDICEFYDINCLTIKKKAKAS